MTPIIVWLRQDLRLFDNAALWEASITGAPILFLYIREPHPPSLPLGGASKWWLHHSLAAFQKSLTSFKQKLILRSGPALQVLREIILETKSTQVYLNQSYEPAITKQDQVITEELGKNEVCVKQFSPSLLFQPHQVKTRSGSFYKMFSPFWKTCLGLPEPPFPLPKPTSLKPMAQPVLSESLSSFCLLPTHPDWASGLRETWIPGERGAQRNWKYFLEKGLNNYHQTRNRPDLPGTSKLSPHLHFGEISPRQVWYDIKNSKAPDLDKNTFLQELGWREFNHHLFYHVPTLPQQNLRPLFNHFSWNASSESLLAWQKGKTGYPIVDAGMRQLWKTGFMHNRVRMITASFLVKDLQIDWRQGQSWFWDTLVDADLANNSANWQWVAGSGTDAAPYFRIFHPVTQGEKFDPTGDYVRLYLPELAPLPTKWIHKPWLAPKQILQKAGILLGETYPHPIVSHEEARQKALLAYYQILKNKNS